MGVQFWKAFTGFAAERIGLLDTDPLLGAPLWAVSGDRLFMDITEVFRNNLGRKLFAFAASRMEARTGHVLQTLASDERFDEVPASNWKIARAVVQGLARTRAPLTLARALANPDVVPARIMERLMKMAEVDGARVVLLGDTGQTKAIEAGRPFHQLQAAGMAAALMGDIIRQKTPELKEAVELAAKAEASASLSVLDRKLQAVRTIKDDGERYDQIASRYAALDAEARCGLHFELGASVREQIYANVEQVSNRGAHIVVLCVDPSSSFCVLILPRRFVC